MGPVIWVYKLSCGFWGTLKVETPCVDISSWDSLGPGARLTRASVTSVLGHHLWSEDLIQIQSHHCSVPQPGGHLFQHLFPVCLFFPRGLCVSAPCPCLSVLSLFYVHR